MKNKEHFKSGLANKFEEFVFKLKTEGKYGRTNRSNLYSFDNYLYSNFPGITSLQVKMLDWLKQRETEKPSSCLTRIRVIRLFLEYAYSRGWSDKFEIETLKKEKSEYIPYIFSHEELDKFFKKCDEMVIETYNKTRSLANLLNKFEVPVFFRLMYSGAFRPKELKELRMEDVDVEAGVFIIRESKNGSERMVVLDDSVVCMLKDYLGALNLVMPQSEWFFPNTKGNTRPHEWQSEHFRKIWRAISDEVARSYDFRHTHITINISSWEERTYEFDGRLVMLMKFVGHSNINQTADYFQYTPMLIQKLKVSSANRFKDLCPPIPKEIDNK